MRKPFIAANWKMNMKVQEAYEYGENLVEYLKRENVDLKKIDVAICPPAIHMASLKVIFVLRNILVGAQNCHYEDQGAYTGEISPLMLKDMGIECCIVGHSERRQYFGETSENCAKKIKALRAKNIRPILCVGESLEDREGGDYRKVISDMLLASLADVTGEEMLATTIAYEPVWAIGTGRTATPDQANEACGYIRSIIGEKYGADVAGQVIIQYGGSVNPENIGELMSMSDIDGALVGGAGLDPAKFAKIVACSPDVLKGVTKVVEFKSHK